MSIFKSLINRLPPTRCCPEHGYGCTRKCSFVRDGYKDGRPFEAFKIKKKKKR